MSDTPYKLAWERFRREHEVCFDSTILCDQAKAEYLENRLACAFASGWNQAREQIEDAFKVKTEINTPKEVQDGK